jgi:hypothetical protein
MADQEVVIFGCGDVGPVHEPVSQFCELAAPVLRTGDIRFGQVERVYSERGSLQLHSGDRHSRVKPGLAAIFKDCGFDVVSVASNHAMDWGDEAMLDSIENLHKLGLKTIGAGRDLREAREPVVIEKKGVKVGFLGYCSVLREGYAAGPHKPGVAPLRAHTFFSPSEYQPGMPPVIHTQPYEEDLAGVVEDVEKLRKAVDVVVVSLHWGLHFIPRAIAQYQVIAAKAIFGAGADMILGHHAHVPKAVGVYGGKPCFFSLSNFIMSTPTATPDRFAKFEKAYGVKLDPEYPNLPYGPDAKYSMIAKAVATKQGIQSTSFLPALIDKKLRPEVLKAGDPKFDETVRYWQWASEGHGAKLEVKGDEVSVSAA